MEIKTKFDENPPIINKKMSKDYFVILRDSILKLNLKRAKYLAALIDFHYRINKLFFIDFKSYCEYFTEFGKLTNSLFAFKNIEVDMVVEFLTKYSIILYNNIDLEGGQLLTKLIIKVSLANDIKDVEEISSWLFKYKDIDLENVYDWMV